MSVKLREIVGTVFIAASFKEVTEPVLVPPLSAFTTTSVNVVVSSEITIFTDGLEPSVKFKFSALKGLNPTKETESV